MNMYTNSLQDFEPSLNTFFPHLPSYKEWVITNLNFTKNVLWNILMCYFIQSERRELKNSILNSFESRLLIRNLKFWNPFRTEECIKELLPHFEKKIWDQYNNSGNKFHSKHEQYIRLQASSILLNTNILLIIKQKDEFGKDILLTKRFPDSPEAVLMSRKKCLVIVDDIQTSETFSFCLTQEKRFNYRKVILKSILSSDLDIDQRICKKICASVNEEEKVLFNIFKYAELEKVFHNFTDFNKKFQVAYFKVELFHIIEQIVLLPKLLEIVDKYLILVYNNIFDRSNCSWLNNTYFPDALLLGQLEKFQNALNRIEESQLISSKSWFDHVQTYNKFLMRICFELGKINRKRESNSINCSINLFYEARLREDMIKCILHNYLKHPSIKNLIEEKVSIIGCECIKNIHLNVTVIYFDNLFHLVESIEVSQKKLSKIINLANELYNVCYEKGSCESISEYYKSYLKSDGSSYKIKEEKYDISLKIRDRDNLLKKHMPKIYEQLFLSQLHYYLSILLKIMDPSNSLDELDEMQCQLIVDRCCQIIDKFLMESNNKLKTIIIKKVVIDPIYRMFYQWTDCVLIKVIKDELCFQDLTKFVKNLEECQKISAYPTSGRNINFYIPPEPNFLLGEKRFVIEDSKKNIGTCKKKIGTIKDLKEYIKKLKMILVDTDESIKTQWENENDPESDPCLRYRITQLLLNKPVIQAFTEMLLYYCMDILKTDDLVNLWCRTASVFNTTNIRNTLMKNMNCLICPLDVFSSSMDFIKKCTELIADRKTIDNILNILEETNVDFHGFMNIMKDKYDDKYENLRTEIMSCDRWKEYAVLIPWNDSCKMQSDADSVNPC